MGLTIGEREKKPFVLCPKGIHNAVCTAVEDLGEVETTFQGKTSKRPMVRITWNTDKLMEDGRPYQASKRYSISSYVDAPLRKDVTAWLGKQFTEEEFKQFDLESLIGKPCKILVAHESKNGKSYANVTAVTEPDPPASFESLSKAIDLCWTANGLDGIRDRALEAQRAGQITTEQLKQLAALSTAKRQRINSGDIPAETADLEADLKF